MDTTRARNVIYWVAAIIGVGLLSLMKKTTDLTTVMILLLIAVGILIALLRLNTTLEGDRTSALEYMISTLGFDGFSFRREDATLSRALAELPFVKQNERLGGFGSPVIRLANFVTGTKEGQGVVVFDYELGGPKRFLDLKHSATMLWTQTVVAFRLRKNSIPLFDLQPKAPLTLFNVGDIRFPYSPEFSHRYVLRGANEQAIRTLFQQRVLDALAAQQEAWVVQGQGEWLIAYRPKVTMPPTVDGLKDVLDEAYNLFTFFGIS